MALGESIVRVAIWIVAVFVMIYSIGFIERTITHTSFLASFFQKFSKPPSRSYKTIAIVIAAIVIGAELFFVFGCKNECRARFYEFLEK